jgi:hypothetical protein
VEAISYSAGKEGAPSKRGAKVRSLWLAQRKVSGFVQALDFIAVKSFVAYLHPGAKGRSAGNSSIAKRMASADVSKRRYLARLPFARLDVNSSAGAS